MDEYVRALGREIVRGFDGLRNSMRAMTPMLWMLENRIERLKHALETTTLPPRADLIGPPQWSVKAPPIRRVPHTARSHPT